jgi:MerR family redox-sensitive transcriptional activator SoxR
MLTIGELARATGVATSALRYWEELGLLPAPERVSGKRRYPSSAVDVVGEILILRDAGYTLREIGRIMTDRGSWRELAERKLAELDERIAKAQAARHAIVHGLACKHRDFSDCPNFARIRDARLTGLTLSEAHGH